VDFEEFGAAFFLPHPSSLIIIFISAAAAAANLDSRSLDSPTTNTPNKQPATNNNLLLHPLPCLHLVLCLSESGSSFLLIDPPPMINGEWRASERANERG
jgi:hypothetical protein